MAFSPNTKAVRFNRPEPSGRLSSAIKKVTRKRSAAVDPSFSVPNKLKDEYTSEELQEYLQVFNMFDTDQSGSIGVEEMAVAMKSMGLNASENDIESLIREVDEDGNGEVDFEEFCAVLSRMNENKMSWKQVIDQCFDVFDRGQNGMVLETDFRHILQEIGGIDDETIVAEIFAEVDVDGNGIIDYDEFAAMVKNYLNNDDVRKDPDD